MYFSDNKIGKTEIEKKSQQTFASSEFDWICANNFRASSCMLKWESVQYHFVSVTRSKPQR